MEQQRLGNLYGEDKGTGFAGNVWDTNAICPALTTMQGGGREPMITEVLRVESEEVQCLSRAEQSRAEQSRAEQSRAEQSRAEQSRAA